MQMTQAIGIGIGWHTDSVGEEALTPINIHNNHIGSVRNPDKLDRKVARRTIPACVVAKVITQSARELGVSSNCALFLMVFLCSREGRNVCVGGGGTED